ncbi:MAG: hypothetical protein AVDCRST_MAG19-699 [uncultured Thermomicrobiales bacterium]|uniref:Uncharacterized protein n=1 Tax=uncultured Thermomicrobiales bacterium TaxID=1645740 RepID=A0A6J4UJT1_9BACT|nr:MAG: hypothetical protein AVDCRST_MAG19-699 [uncultured Thermomicrobiales bacterium]
MSFGFSHGTLSHGYRASTCDMRASKVGNGLAVPTDHARLSAR